jgi:hypothetical protein
MKRPPLVLLALLLAGILLPGLRPVGSAELAIQPTFDHWTTGFELTGQHRDLPCESCHVNAVFKGTPKECSSCHGVGTVVRATAKPVNHILTSDRCDACHTPVAWKPAVSFDHIEVRGSCSTCHNNVQAQGMGPQHIATDLECNVCHSTLSWSGAVFTHEGVTGNCASCHDGVRATGMPANHIPTAGAACESCHSPTNFLNWTGAQMNHTVVGSISCATCHEAGDAGKFAGVTIVTRPAPPHPMTGDCGQCHTTASFTGGTLMPANHIPLPSSDAANCALCHANQQDFSLYAMNHVNIAGNCVQCHGAGLSFANMAPPVLVQPPANHVPIGTVSCEKCHSGTNFTSFAMNDVSGTAPPAMVHSVVAGAACATCHASGKSFVGSPAVVTPPANHVPIGSAACESCHAGSNFTSFVMSNVTGTAPPAMVHTAVGTMACSTCHELGKSFVGSPAIVTRPTSNHVSTGECSTCHFSTVSFLGATNYPNGHIPLPGGSASTCSACHSSTTDYSLYTMNHTVVAGTACAACHAAGLSFANMAPPTLKEPPANHVPVGSAACESCHAGNNFTSFAMNNVSGTAPPAMVHTAVAGVACATCHASGKSFAGSPATVTLPGNHVPIGSAACESCHRSDNVTSFAFTNASGTAPPSMVHGAVSAMACSTCHELGKSFVGSPAVVTRPATNHVTTGECSTCHFSTTTFLGASTYPANHIPVPAADSNNCALCHSNANDYSVYAMNHVNIASNCAQCHAAGLSFVNMAPPTLKEIPSNHVPVGSTACESCHSTTNFSTFAGTGMNHAGFTSNCIACHGPGLSFVAPVTTLPANHVPTGGAACESCHSPTTFGSFAFTNATGTAPPAMVHSVVASIACSTCHEAGKSFIGSPPIVTRPATVNGVAHVAGGECSSCHFSTVSFAGASNYPSNHIPVPAADNNNCSLCHTNLNDYSVYTMNHVNIGSNCAQCHGPGLSFANMAPPTLKEPPTGSPAHIPYWTAACEACHTPTVFTSFSATVMKHAAVLGKACTSCHELGMKWYGEPNLWVRPSANHHAGQDCGGSGCHTSRDKMTVRPSAATSLRPQLRAVLRAGTDGAATPATAGVGRAAPGQPAPFNHLRVGSTDCASCHNGATATGKPVGHIATTASCGSCHTTLSWQRVALVDHLQVLGTCANCHNGVTASGKPLGHVITGGGCETCHTSNAWTPARFDHGTLSAAACGSCHDGVHAIGKPSMHVPTQQDCSNCHGTLAWKPAKLDHTGLLTNCAACHNNLAATGLPSIHMISSRDCASCHRYPDWTQVSYRHVSAAYPGDHRTAIACAACHAGGTDQASYSAPAYAGSCAGCHAAAFRADAHPKTGRAVVYTIGELRNCSGACHLYNQDGSVAKSLPGPYHRVTDAAFKH